MSTDPSDPGSPVLRPLITEGQLDSMLERVNEKYTDPSDPRRKIIESLCLRWKSLMLGDVTPQQRVEALEDFTNLALHGLLQSEAADEVSETAVWAPAKQYHGYSNAGRLRVDAYPDDSPSRLLNGKRGSIVAIRRGEVIMDLDVPALDGVRQVRGDVSLFEVNISHLTSRR